ncbi:MAG TPA: enoyl-CoA hydratase/isomerase family protein [bacterium]|nr:enoyl-CoA hydratase/isomerase family protein [bacterium]
MIDVTQHDGIAILQMQHGKANALDIEFCHALAHAVDNLRHVEVHGLILTGTGTMFSAGVDLPRLIKSGPEYIPEFLAALHHTFETLFTFPKPMIAAINGHAIAGGCVLAACADYRIMAGGRIGVSELRVGVPFPVSALEIMRSVVPQKFLSEVLYDAKNYTPDEAKTVGLIDAIIGSNELMSEALKKVKAWSAIPATAFAITKRQLQAPYLDRIHHNAIDTYVVNLWKEPATLNAIGNFVASTIKKT